MHAFVMHRHVILMILCYTYYTAALISIWWKICPDFYLRSDNESKSGDQAQSSSTSLYNV